MASDEKPSPTAPGAFQRIFHSKTKAARTSPELRATTSFDNTTQVTENGTPKLTALERLKSLLVSKSKKQPKIPFPPPSWFEDGKVVHAEASGAAAVLLPPTPGEDQENDPLDDGNGNNTNRDEGRDDGDQSPPPATWIASQIKAIINSLPPLPTGTSSRTTDAPPADDDGSNKPQSPPTIDSKLLRFLSSATVMNGSISKGRQSVWSALERLQGPSPASDIERHQGGESDDDSDEQSIMMYAPLVPNSHSKVELANSHTEFVSIDQQVELGASQDDVGISKWPWPFGGWGGKQKEGIPAEGNSKVPSNGQPSGKNGRTKPKVKKVTVWEPSTTTISFQATWWGYRLYLPPPVIVVLNDKALEGAKRAAIITTALKWMVDHIPVAMLPPQLRPVLIVLQRLVPIVGYVGAFIAWSWSAIKSFDKGYGVILTATWLLPVALIPSTWEAKDWPSLPSPSPAPVPAPAPVPSSPPTGSAGGNTTPSGETDPRTSLIPAPTVPSPSNAIPLLSQDADAKTKTKKK